MSEWTWKEWKPIIMRSGTLSKEISVAFREFVKANPIHVKNYKNTLLWVVSRNPPIFLVKAVITADPNALCRKEPFVINMETYNITPLGVACRCGVSVNVVACLLFLRLKLHEAVGQKRKRHHDDDIVPFYPFQTTGYNEDWFPPAYMRVLLEYYPQGATMPHTFDGRPMLEEVLTANRFTPYYWENINLVMMAAAFGTVKQEQLDGRQFLLLHSFLELICCVGAFRGGQRDYNIDFALEFLQYIQNQAPQQFLMVDSNGRLPLHVAMQNTAFGWNRTHTAQFWTFLVQEHPESAGIADPDGRLALHVAVQHGLPCIDVLLEAEPEALEKRSMATYLYPYELVSYGISTNTTQLPPEYIENEALDLIYQMLRMAPNVAKTRAQQIPREAYMDTPEYKEYLANKLKMAQIDYQSKLDMAAIDAKNVQLKKKFGK